MWLTVEHVTRYRYDMPVRGVVQSHRLQPADFTGQKVLGWEVTVTDGLRGGGFRDGAGDWVQGWSVTGPVAEIAVTVRGTVETTDMAGVLTGHRETVPPMAYLRATAPTRADAGLMALAGDAGGDGLEAAHRLAAAVANAIAYIPGSTEARTTAAEALAQGSGVCQDQAHALIAVARHASLPARYVSGYLLSVPDDEGDAPPPVIGQRQSQVQGAPLPPVPMRPALEAAHAWAEIHIEGLGWVGFDPANRCCPDARYIRLGSGYDAQDAAPIRGTARGRGTERLEVVVAVQSIQQ